MRFKLGDRVVFNDRTPNPLWHHVIATITLVETGYYKVTVIGYRPQAEAKPANKRSAIGTTSKVNEPQAYMELDQATIYEATIYEDQSLDDLLASNRPGHPER